MSMDVTMMVPIQQMASVFQNRERCESMMIGATARNTITVPMATHMYVNGLRLHSPHVVNPAIIRYCRMCPSRMFDSLASCKPKRLILGGRHTLGPLAAHGRVAGRDVALDAEGVDPSGFTRVGRTPAAYQKMQMR